ncbi:MAG: OmpA family protein [Bacteroidales bacterium]|nr:OmpA family protein [Bacteroidales bacterium]
MKKIVTIFALSTFFLMSQESLSGQEKEINKAIDELEKGIGGLFKKDKKKNTPPQSETGQSDQVSGKSEDASVTAQTEQDKTKPSLVWSKYDFVPGDNIIFEDNLLDEENGEFPSRWDLHDGNTENAVFGDENVIMFRGGHPAIVPYLKNPGTDYLPEVFTIEFDLYLPYNDFTIYFYDRKNQSAPSGSNYLGINSTGMYLNPASSNIPEGKTIKKVWTHIAIAYTNGKLKAYIDETRLINIPRLSFNPSGLTLLAYHANDDHPFFIKNIRIAEGGVKHYDRFLQDGKIVSNGIRFDVGKASLRPESMGVLNSIFKLLSAHPEVNFSIEGHTDSDGDSAFNQKLSEERAKTVMDQLVSMGIDSDRLTSKGFGESNPINTKDTPEGKAVNRRVEFVKNN